MTDRLSTLLHDEADRLEIPAPRTADVLIHGRRVIRRRARTLGAATVAVVAIAGGSLMVGHRQHHDTATPVAPASEAPEQLAYSVGDTVYLGDDGSVSATMPEVPQTLYYTSAGVLVRTNRTGASDGGAPFHFELVEPDGTTSKLGVTLGHVVPSADPNQPYLAWATMQGGHIQVVVHDVTTDQDVTTLDVPGSFTWGGWSAPPVALDGDIVYVATDHATTTVNWRTGATGTTQAVPAAFPDVRDGHALVSGLHGSSVVDVATGKQLLDLGRPMTQLAMLSPDGRYAALVGFTGGPPHPLEVYDVATGNKLTLSASGDSWGWSSLHELFTVHGDHLMTCDPTDGRCTASRVPASDSSSSPENSIPVRYAGRVYES
jgi:hypothetical protein